MSEPKPVDILLAEDNPNDAELTIRALKKQQVTNNIIWVKDGVAALDYILRRGDYAERPDDNLKLVLLDLKMPKVDGIDVLRTIKSNPATRSIPVVVLTSSAEEKDIVSSYDLGVNSYVVKPVTFEDFAAEVVKLGCYWTLSNKVPD
ncbi:MAG TPA: response regulator [Burkholderiales bacterium]